MSKRYFHTVFTVLLAMSVLCLLPQCKKKTNTAETNPAIDTCSGKSPVSAGFKVMQALDFGKFVEDDTVACYPSFTDTANKTKICNTCFLQADETNAAFYKWQVGANTSDKRRMELSFKKAYGIIKAQLNVEKMPNQGCFPNDDGKDLVEKVFYVKEYNQHPLIGKYIGAFEDTPKDTLDVEIKAYPLRLFQYWVEEGRPKSKTAYPRGFDDSYGGAYINLCIWGLIRNNWLEIPLTTSHAFQLNDISETYGYKDVCFLGKKNFGWLKDGVLTIELEYCNPCSSDCGLKYNSQGIAEYNPNSWKTRKAIFKKIN